MKPEKYKICPECGKRNLPSLLECEYCEADLTCVKIVDSEARQQEEHQIQESSQETRMPESRLVRICECGAENLPQARKCAVCGEDISDIMPTPAEVREENNLSYELTSIDGTFTRTFDKPVAVIGREAELKEYLEAKLFVSRQHARMTIVLDKVFIENLSHTNKTFVNNHDVPDEEPVEVKDGDEIGLGGKVIDGKRQDQAAYLTVRVKG